MGVAIPQCHLSRGNFLPTSLPKFNNLYLLDSSDLCLLDYRLNRYLSSLASFFSFFFLNLCTSFIGHNRREVQVRKSFSCYIPKVLKPFPKTIGPNDPKSVRDQVLSCNCLESLFLNLLSFSLSTSAPRGARSKASATFLLTNHLRVAMKLSLTVMRGFLSPLALPIST